MNKSQKLETMYSKYQIQLLISAFLIFMLSSCSTTINLAEFQDKYVVIQNNMNGERLTVENDSVKIRHYDGNLASQTFYLGTRYDPEGEKVYFLGQSSKVVMSSPDGFYLVEPTPESTISNMFFLPTFIINKENNQLRLMKPFTTADFADELGKILTTQKQKQLQLSWTGQNGRVFLDSVKTGDASLTQSWQFAFSPCQPFSWDSVRKEADGLKIESNVEINTSVSYHIASPAYKVFTLYYDDQGWTNSSIRVHDKQPRSVITNTGVTQHFSFKKQSDGTYSIINDELNRAITINECNQVYHDTPHNRKTQRFIVEKGLIDPTAVRIRSAYSNHYITLGSDLAIDSPDSKANQEFRLIKNANKQIKNISNPKSFQVEETTRSETLSLGIFKLSHFDVSAKDQSVVVINDALVYNVLPNKSDNETGVAKNTETNRWDLITSCEGYDVSKIQVNTLGHLWILTRSGIAHRLNQDSGSSYYWEPQNEQSRIKFIDISLGDYGTLWGITEAGDIHRYLSKDRWERVEGQKLKLISIINENEVWGINKKGDLVHFSVLSNDWHIKGNAKELGIMQLSAGTAFDVWMLDKDGQAYYYEHAPDKISVSSGSPKFSQISAGSDGTVWGIDDCFTVHVLNSEVSWKEYIYSGPQKFPDDGLFLSGESLIGEAFDAARIGGESVTKFKKSLSAAIEKYNKELGEDKTDFNVAREAQAGEVSATVLYSAGFAGITAYHVASWSAVAASAQASLAAASAAAATGGTATAAATTTGTAAGITAGLAVAGVAAVIIATAVPLILAAKESNINIIVVNDTDVPLILDGDEIFIKHGRLMESSSAVNIPPRTSGPSISLFAFEKKYGLIGTEGILRFKQDACKDFAGLAIGWGVPYRDKGALRHKNKVYTAFKPAKNDEIYKNFIDKDLRKAVTNYSDESGDYKIYGALDSGDSLFPTMVVYISKSA